MSDQNEHVSEETESEANTENYSNEQSKCEASILNNQTEMAMLEDEEMPTYISVTSPSRCEDLDSKNSKQQETIAMETDHSPSPYPSDDQGGDSVYVLSSGEESDRPPYNDEDDDDEYADSEDIDGHDHENAIMEDEEEEDEEDEDDINPLRLHDDDDEAICFDRASDDFILNNRLKQHHKERSLSLQDLSICKNNIRSPYNKERYSLNILRQNYLGLHQNPVIYPVTCRKRSVPIKYQHVESKVKRYIQDMKEQSRRSMEKRIKDQECITNRNHTESENDTKQQIKSARTNKIIKDYVERGIKDLQREEDNDGNLLYSGSQIIKNGKNKKSDLKVTVNKYRHIQRDNDMQIYCDSMQNEKNIQNFNDRREKRNGSIGIDAHCQGSLDENIRFNAMDQANLVNGHQQTPTLFNLRTLSYEEYMHTSNTEHQESLTRSIHATQKENNEPETYNDAEIINVPETDNSNMSSPLKFENIKSIQITSVESENLNFEKLNQADKPDSENTEVAQHKTQLNQSQINALQVAYQKVLAENLKMKQEIEVLEQSLEKYKSESKSPETKAASVQTEPIVDPLNSQEPSKDSKEANQSKSNQKVTSNSAVSTVSSIDHWADSACSSPTISIKLPDITNVMTSDDSVVLTDGRPRKTVRPISKAFITSSRILQTLSNITHCKTKTQSPLVRDSNIKFDENLPDQFLSVNCNSPIEASSFKKRKATDMLGSSTYAQPFKIPHTSIESEKKNQTDVELKHSDERKNSKLGKEQNSTTVNTSRSQSPVYVENKVEETDNDDNIKCFVYQEDENSKNKSFLIQAEEPTKESIGKDKGRIQECGPYLLGNLEVRMSDINGTISVWGKETNEESMIDDEEEIETKTADKKAHHCCQKTRQIRFSDSPLVCSTGKKLKVPRRLSGSSVSHCSHSRPLNVTKEPLHDTPVKKHMYSPLSLNTCVPSCENCDSAKYSKDYLECKRISNSQENIHSCCVHHTEPVENEYSCSYQERQKYEDGSNRSKDKFNIEAIRRSFCKNKPDSNKHLHGNIGNFTAEINETNCRSNKTCQCSSQNFIENYQHITKCCSTVRDVANMYKSPLANTSSHENMSRHTCTHNPCHENDEVPLISHKQSNETPEAKQRRLSGKKVRGILMDLLKGCRDCHNPNASYSKSRLREKETSCLSNGPPEIKISSCPSPEPSCSRSTQCNERCCHAYARRIESQLEEFRIEMERVRSRSDAILDVLSRLHSVDMM